MTEQMVNVRLDCYGLPHIRLGLAIFGIEGFFIFGELPALLFQRFYDIENIKKKVWNKTSYRVDVKRMPRHNTL